MEEPSLAASSLDTQQMDAQMVRMTAEGAVVRYRRVVWMVDEWRKSRVRVKAVCSDARTLKSAYW